MWELMGLWFLYLFLWLFYFSVCWLALSNLDMIVLVSSYDILLRFIVISQKLFLLVRDRKRGDPDWRWAGDELEGVEEGKLFRLYLWEKNLCLIKGKNIVWNWKELKKHHLFKKSTNLCLKMKIQWSKVCIKRRLLIFHWTLGSWPLR